MARHYRVPFCTLPSTKIFDLEQIRRERERLAYMQDVDAALLNWIRTSPEFAAFMQGTVSYAYPKMHEDMLTFMLGGYQWEISFTTGHKCPGLRVATLKHPRLDVIVREQNPRTETVMGQLKRSGREVWQVYVGGQPEFCILDAAHWYPKEMRAASGAAS